MPITQDEAEQMSAHILLNPDAIEVLMQQMIKAINESPKGVVLGKQPTTVELFLAAIARSQALKSTVTHVLIEQEQAKYQSKAMHDSVLTQQHLQKQISQSYANNLGQSMLEGARQIPEEIQKQMVAAKQQMAEKIRYLEATEGRVESPADVFKRLTGV